MMDVAILFFEDPNAVTYLKVLAGVCRMGGMDDAMDKFSEMVDMGVPHETTVCRLKLFREMLSKRELKLQLILKLGQLIWIGGSM